MRTTTEILQRIDTIKTEDFFGFESGDLIARLVLADARPFLKPDYDGADWKVLPRDREALLAEIKGYLPFAWDKATDQRGISASRSISHMRAWFWLLGDDDLNAIDWERYNPYGEPILKQIAARVGVTLE